MRLALVVAILAATGGAAAAEPAAVTTAAVPMVDELRAPTSKKDQYLAAKAQAKGKPAVSSRRIGAPAPPVLSLYNTWTHEWLALDADPRARLPADATVDRFLRCHFTNQSTAMRDELIATLREAASHFSARRIDIVSGYRSPKYNLMLRKKGHEVAKDSQHTQGHAVDFRIPGIDVRTLESWALGRHKGGVGLYLESKFIHVDVGPFRRWNGT